MVKNRRENDQNTQKSPKSAHNVRLQYHRPFRSAWRSGIELRRLLGNFQPDIAWFWKCEDLWENYCLSTTVIFRFFDMGQNSPSPRKNKSTLEAAPPAICSTHMGDWTAANLAAVLFLFFGFVFAENDEISQSAPTEIQCQPVTRPNHFSPVRLFYIKFLFELPMSVGFDTAKRLRSTTSKK